MFLKKINFKKSGITWYPELVLEVTTFVIDLDPVVICVGYDNVLIDPKTEAMWRVEVCLAWT